MIFEEMEKIWAKKMVKNMAMNMATNMENSFYFTYFILNIFNKYKVKIPCFGHYLNSDK